MINFKIYNPTRVFRSKTYLRASRIIFIVLSLNNIYCGRVAGDDFHARALVVGLQCTCDRVFGDAPVFSRSFVRDVCSI